MVDWSTNESGFGPMVASWLMITTMLSKYKLVAFDGRANPFLDPSLSIAGKHFVYGQVLRPIRTMIESGVYGAWVRNYQRVREFIGVGTQCFKNSLSRMQDQDPLPLSSLTYLRIQIRRL